jgi:hypothetical protein
MIKIPITIAKIAMSILSPEKLKLSSCISPSTMSQIPNKSMLRFLGSLLVSFIAILLSANELRAFVGKHRSASRTDTQDLGTLQRDREPPERECEGIEGIEWEAGADL